MPIRLALIIFICIACRKVGLWRIPLPDRTSVGVVINPNISKKYGSNQGGAGDNILRSDDTLIKFTKNAKRETGVVQYNNYQLITERMYGKNWLLIGDAAGFPGSISHLACSGNKSAFTATEAIEEATMQHSKVSETGRCTN